MALMTESSVTLEVVSEMFILIRTVTRVALVGIGVGTVEGVAEGNGVGPIVGASDGAGVGLTVGN